MNNNIGNRIISKEEILEIAGQKMDKLKSEYPEQLYETLLEFHYKAREIESWINTKLNRLPKSKNN